MASSSSRFSAFLLCISSLVFVGFSDLGDFLQSTDSIVRQQAELPTCMQKLLPCQPFVKSPEHPPPMCCLPLMAMLAGDVGCLCSFFNNTELLKALNVTQSDALKLPKACGAAVDMSKCNHAAATPPTRSTEPPPSPPAPPAPPVVNTSTGSSASNNPRSSSSRKNNPAYGISYGVAAASSFLAFLLHFKF